MIINKLIIRFNESIKPPQLLTIKLNNDFFFILFIIKIIVGINSSPMLNITQSIELVSFTRLTPKLLSKGQTNNKFPIIIIIITSSDEIKLIMILRRLKKYTKTVHKITTTTV